MTADGPAAGDDSAAAAKTADWRLAIGGHEHHVQIVGTFSRTSSWYVDDARVESKKTSDNDVVLAAEGTGGLAVGIKFDGLGRAKRVTLFEGDGQVAAKAQAVLGAGGIDFDPEPGSRAALRQQRIREHPRRHAAIALAEGVAKVAVPLVLGLLIVRLVIQLPWPDWQIPWPDIDLPNIPWPNIPWPDINLPDWELPGWLSWFADRLKYVWPILLALLLAGGEIKRQRKQDALKAEKKSQRAVDGDSTAASASPEKERPSDPKE